MNFNESESKLEWNQIETKWKSKWNEQKLFDTDPDDNKIKKYFITVAFPYPNSPQHIGHGRTYTLADVHARYMRMKGNNVLFPMAFHYTGTPILAMSKRVISGDKDLIQTFKNIYNVPEEIIKTFSDPEKIARYFHNEIKLGMQDMGYSIDWRREFTTIDKLYFKFITWQFKILQKKGLIVQGSHPVGWCPKDNNPVSQHDTVGDVEPEFNEYILIKFRLSNSEIFLPVVTLRPETIFGVTNLWINPDIDYIEIEIDQERWIVTREARKKLEFLNHNIKILNVVSGKNLIGKNVISPICEKNIQIFPANFVLPDTGTGIVMSVPSHAPFDYQAIKDLKKDPHIYKNELNLNEIQPIKIIELKTVHTEDNNKNRSEYENKSSISSPTVSVETVISKYGINNQMDPALEKATNDLYSIEYYKGIMLPNTGIYSGMDVKDAKEKIKILLFAKNQAEIFYEFVNQPITCRCGSECVVKLLNDQWFINYGDTEWKNKVHNYIDSMSIIPEELRQEFHNVVDWLKERACARKSGLGTKLPWDREWIIESLSDSVVYMAYYTISKFVNSESHSINQYIDEIDESFFDFILFGEGDINDIERRCKIDKSLLEKLRKEFIYFYPVDCRHSGRDLVPNHLSFFIFNHVAIFEKKYWPKQMVINGSVLMEGKKMSKSLGNIIPIRTVIQNYGADTIRLCILISAELLQDADFSFEIAKSIRSKLYDLYNQALDSSYKSSVDKTFIQKLQEFQSSIRNDEFEDLLYSYLEEKENFLELEDKWMINKLQRFIHNVTESMEALRVREALHHLLYVFDQDIQWYKKWSLSKGRKENHYVNIIFLLSISLRIKMLSPFAPFISEEIWEKFGNKKSINLSKWPIVYKEKIDPLVEESEEFIKNLIDDINKIIKITKKIPSTVYIYCSSIKKQIIYNQILASITVENQTNFGNIMQNLINNPETSEAKHDPSLVKKMIEDILSASAESRSNRLQIKVLDESFIIEYGKELISTEITKNNPVKIIVYSENDPQRFDPKQRSKFSRPYKPAIYLD